MSDPTSNPPGTPAPADAAAAAKTAPAPAKAAAPPRPAPPAKPAAAKPSGQRRFFLFSLVGSWAALGWTSLTASLVAMTLGTLRFLVPNVLSEKPTKFKVGDPSQFEESKVVDRYKDDGFWIVRYKGEVYALSTTCTHLGCTPNWLEADRKFKCPCHGSGFYITGVNFEGPAPRPLERYAVRLEEGQLVIDKSKKFQKELGQWTEPDSYIAKT